MKRSLMLVAVLASIALVVPMASANHTAGYHWRHKASPFNVRLINGSAGVWRDAVVRGASRWTQSPRLNIKVLAGGNSCQPVQGRVKVCSGNFSGGWAGLTEVAQNGPHVVWATIKLDNSAVSAARAVACHEIGHALGLAHRAQSESTSCLTPTVSASQVRPDTHDLRMLGAIYRHNDGANAKAADDGKTVIHRYRTYL
jgi:hypothetical protein